MNTLSDLLAALPGNVGEYAGLGMIRRTANAKRTIHVAVMAEPFLTFLLEGKKTIESRFSKHAIAPYRQIKPGDLVLVKRTGGPVTGYFTVGKVLELQLGRTSLERIKTDYGSAICADASFWEAQQNKRYATLITVQDVHSMHPIPLAKRDRRGWVTYGPEA